MNTIFILASCLSVCFCAEDSLDYCSIILCNAGKHIGCKNDGKLSSTCPEDTKIIEFTPTVIEALLNEHNEIRNQLAGGKLTGFEPAARMATMQWDPLLAHFASLYVYRCSLTHYRCVSTQKFPNAGLHIHTIYTNDGENDETLVAQKVKEWFNDYKDGTLASNIDHPPVIIWTSQHFYFLTKIAEINFAVGCGAVLFKNNPDTIFKYKGYLACGYADYGYSGALVYTPSAAPASGCKKKNPNYPNLCSVEEVYKLYFQKPSNDCNENQ